MNKRITDIIESWGFIGDWDMACALYSFLEYSMSKNDERRDSKLRLVNHHLSRVLEREDQSRVLEFVVKNNAKMKTATTTKSIHCQWLTYQSQKDISIEGVVKSFHMNPKEAEFLKAIHYKSLRIGVAVAIIDELIESVSFIDDSEL